MKNQIDITYSDKIKDRSNDPYFVKKAEKSRKTIERHGFPAELLKIQAERKPTPPPTQMIREGVNPRPKSGDKN